MDHDGPDSQGRSVSKNQQKKLARKVAREEAIRSCKKARMRCLADNAEAPRHTNREPSHCLDDVAAARAAKERSAVHPTTTTCCVRLES